ncbi:hypothetical protein BDZ94DRAFT_172659 [Collybia nuda]|uniref:Uncharacterized protein n=1 Tax=Collybia nuda TaxID=64659 RepID=A0A9P5YF59_9AGAR|nr:hypothetical protein BDZ94DRAFT_172659 [Collybia nuda]
MVNYMSVCNLRSLLIDYDHIPLLTRHVLQSNKTLPRSNSTIPLAGGSRLATGMRDSNTFFLEMIHLRETSTHDIDVIFVITSWMYQTILYLHNTCSVNTPPPPWPEGSHSHCNFLKKGTGHLLQSLQVYVCHQDANNYVQYIEVLKSTEILYQTFRQLKVLKLK